MIRRIARLTLALVTATALMSGAALAAGDAAKGKKVYNKCKACHSLKAGKNKIGPSLNGIIGRASASEDGFKYSKAMKGANLTWDEETLQKVSDQAQEIPSRHQDGLPRTKKGKATRRSARLPQRGGDVGLAPARVTHFAHNPLPF